MGDAIKFVATGGIDSAVNALKPKEPRFPEDDQEADKDAAEAKQRERERIRRGSGSNRTRLSGSVSEALNARVGRTTLGGVR